MKMVLCGSLFEWLLLLFFTAAVDLSAAPSAVSILNRESSSPLEAVQLRIINWRKRLVSIQGARAYGASVATLDRAQFLIEPLELELERRTPPSSGLPSGSAAQIRAANQLLDRLGSQ